MPENFVLIWALSNSTSWALLGINTPLGDTINSGSFKNSIRTISFIASTIAIITTWTIITTHAPNNLFGLGFSFLFWTVPHFISAVYTVVATSYKFATS